MRRGYRQFILVFAALIALPVALAGPTYAGQTTLRNTGGRELMIDNDDGDSTITFHDSMNMWYSIGMDFSDGRRFKINAGGQLGDTAQFSMDGNGKVGIGTNSPGARLEVEQPWGSGGPDDIAAFFGGRDANSGRYNIYITGHTIAGGYNNNTDDAHLWLNWQGYEGGHTRFRDLRIGNGKGSAVMFVDGSSSSVGIGTMSPDHALDVNGTIRAKEIIVASNWSDFVFDDGYDLPSLSDVESHIAEHGHLPDIPSAAHMQENGLAVAETQTLMMQKIEELTLYAIEQDKEIETLKKENARLSAVEKRLAELEALLARN